MSFQPCTPEEGEKYLQQLKKEINEHKKNQKTVTWTDKASKMDAGSLIQLNGQVCCVDNIENHNSMLKCNLKPCDEKHPAFINHDFNPNDDVTFVSFE